MAENANVIRGEEGAANQPMRAPSLGERILTLHNRGIFLLLDSSVFSDKLLTKKYSVRRPYLIHIEFLIDFKNKESEVITTAYDCDALIITLFSSNEKILPDRNLVKETFYVRTNEIDLRDPNLHRIVIDTQREIVANKHVDGSNWTHVSIP